MLVACVLGLRVRVRRRTKSRCFRLPETGAAHRICTRDEEDKDAKARRVVRANNFTQQTNALDVDKHMCVFRAPSYVIEHVV